MDSPAGLIIAAPHSGSGKTLITLGLCRALTRAGVAVAPAKTGPDYIDPAFLTKAAGRTAINLDPWAMSATMLKALAFAHARADDILLVEGVMGLFDGAAGGGGSTADLAALLNLPVVLVVDASHMAQSIAALVSGFANFRPDCQLAGCILNKVASARHETILRQALKPLGIPIIGVVGRNNDLQVPSRHLGLTLPGEVSEIDTLIERAANDVATAVDLVALQNIALPLANATPAPGLAPLGQHIAIARDAAFVFCYKHHLINWQRAGVTLSFFSPLANEPPHAEADAVFLPGGYPELHGAQIAAADRFATGLLAARARNALVYGECGGYIVLGEGLVDKNGVRHAMPGLLPVETRIDAPRRILGYRQLTHQSALPWAPQLNGHEFHYSTAAPTNLPPLFSAIDATGATLPPMGAQLGRVVGSYAHIIAEASA